MIIDSKILSGGIEERMMGQVFSQSAISKNEELQQLINEQQRTIQAKGVTTESD